MGNGEHMRLFYFLLILLTGNGIALAEGDAPTAMCETESQACPPSEARDGACQHPSLVFDTQAQAFRLTATDFPVTTRGAAF